MLIHYGEHFEHIAKLFERESRIYVWTHDLVTLHHSDNKADYPLWKPAEADKLEAGLPAAGIPIRESHRALKESQLHTRRAYLVRL